MFLSKTSGSSNMFFGWKCILDLFRANIKRDTLDTLPELLLIYFFLWVHGECGTLGSSSVRDMVRDLFV